MSKLKSPRAKKAASLARDRRNRYGENTKASRKNIPKAKARTERALRRAVHVALATNDLGSDEGLDHAETSLTEAARDRKSHGFRKRPDVPLGLVISGPEPEDRIGGRNLTRDTARFWHGKAPTHGTPRRKRKP